MSSGFYIINFDVFNNSEIAFEIFERSEQHIEDERATMVFHNEKEKETKRDELIGLIKLKMDVVEFFKHKRFVDAVIEFSKKDFMISITEKEKSNYLSVNDLTTEETILSIDIDKKQSFNNIFKIIHSHLFDNE